MAINFMNLKRMSTEQLKNRLIDLDLIEHRNKGKKISTVSIHRERKIIFMVLEERSSRRLKK